MSAPTDAELAEAIADLEKRFAGDPGLRETMLDLFKRGLIVAGDHHRDGHIVWAAAQISPRH